MRSYSVAALVFTIKPRQTNTQCYRVMQLRSVSIQQEGLKEEILTKIKSDIGEFSHLVDRHGVCGNNNKWLKQKRKTNKQTNKLTNYRLYTDLNRYVLSLDLKELILSADLICKGKEFQRIGA